MNPRGRHPSNPDPDSNVLDTTWPPDEPRTYIGIPIQLGDIARAAADTEPLLFGDWYRGFPLLRSHTDCCQPLPPGTVLVTV